ncbi:hypothetical protein RB195_011320 [Necator americanus]|uniref:protein-tyrosine-phosphatase n=2 Tax=Necator americanus TaxID=51031 RepID=A0ABR1D1V1_NECAM
MRFGSGSYDVRRSEGLNPSLLTTARHEITCTVAFLDGTERQFQVDRHAHGYVLLDKVFAHLELVERDFFGLQFLYVLGTKETQKRWLEPNKSIRKQMLCPPFHLCFRVKFYVSDPSKLTEEYTRYHFFLQIRLDILEGRLRSTEGSLALLASYAVQSELGDYNPEDHPEGYLNQYRFAPGQTADFGKKVAELHAMHRGQTPAEAEFNFLDHAKRLDMYGVELFPAKDGKGLPIGIGVNSYGMVIFHEGSKINEFAWATIMKISFKKKHFYVQIRLGDQHTPDTVLSFHVTSSPACKLLWKACIEHHTFFRLIAPPIAPTRGLLSIGSKYRYCGRTEFQTMEDVKHRARVERTFQRSHSKTSFLRSTFSGVPSCDTSRTFTPTTASPDIASRILSVHSRTPRRIMPSEDSVLLSTPPLNGYCSEGTLSRSRRPVVEDSESSAPSLRRRPRETTFGVSEDDTSEERNWTPAMQACTSTAAVHHRPPSGGTSTTSRKTNGFLSNGCSQPSSAYGSYSPATATLSNGYVNGTLSSKPPLNAARASPRLTQGCGASPRSSVASYSSHTSGIGASPPMARRSPQSNKSNSPVTEDSLVTVRMRPDGLGRFGFNVKGGADQNYPVIVSRVAPGSSADKAHPRLNEGDQVLFINGRDVAPMSHDMVVDFIRSARVAPNGGELVLTIKPNVYRLGEEVEEPEGASVPEPLRVAESVPRSDKLSHSLRLLSDALTSGRVVAHFEQLYRKKPGMTMNDCRLPQNLNKNRYRDVCPYDATRVHLSSSSTGDYINANYVNMEIPSSGIVNRYIACQGPLAHTSADHWLMVWEQLCTHIVMLTTTIERGRAKCHQYWPRLHESHEYGRLLVTCIRDHETPNCTYREFSVKDRTSKEERRVTQMQYTAWPDHGVPDDPQHFIAFVDEVRRARAGSVDPIVVHCSAGIGRTGVLILMETAACLVEANEPVYPLDIVRVMRDQRAMAIQTAGQYTFVCESILRAYNEGIIKPLAEYQKR